MTAESSPSYHEDMRGKVRGLLIEVEPRLATETVRLLDELIDHNEFGVALEMLVAELVGQQKQVSEELLTRMDDLAGIMQLDDVSRDIQEDRRP